MLWGGEPLPLNKWIGMKYIVYNKEESTVRLELYIDSTSNATPPGKWELVGAAEDAGKDWSGASGGAAKIEGCKDYNGLENAYDAILKGGGVVIMRTDEDHPFYKFVTVREIDPALPIKGNGPTAIRHGANRTARHPQEKLNAKYFNLLGRRVPNQ